jgi:hypothetical protein
MSDFIPTKILEVMNTHCRGRKNAQPRAWIETRLRHWSIDITDRKIRAYYAGLPICSSEDGLFIPIRPDEVQEYRRYLEPKLPAAKIDLKIRRIVATWPHLCPVPKHEQLGLSLTT